MTNKLRVLVFPVGKPGEVQEIDPGLDSMQRMVGKAIFKWSRTPTTPPSSATRKGS